MAMEDPNSTHARNTSESENLEEVHQSLKKWCRELRDFSLAPVQFGVRILMREQYKKNAVPNTRVKTVNQESES